MSHSKLERQSLEERFPRLSRWLVACPTCGRKGRDATADWDTFQPPGFGPWVRDEMLRSYGVLPLDPSGLCADCAAAVAAAQSID